MTFIATQRHSRQVTHVTSAHSGRRGRLPGL